MDFQSILSDEALRCREFPVAAHRVFMAHAAVTALPRVAADALRQFAEAGSADNQETDVVWARVLETRKTAAELLGCATPEVALVGPTALGLNLVANGLDWSPGDEVVYYGDDYPANVYPWTKLSEMGVRPVALQPAEPGAVTWELVERSLTPQTKLVALASCHYLSGYRIDVARIGRHLHERGILFCLDGIQSVGAFPVPLEHVDFLAADSHKWMLGPVAAGVLYVKSSRQERLRPSLLGAWNVVSPDFIAQERIEFEQGGRRYEPGSMNLPGLLGMLASMRLLLDAGVDLVSSRILHLRDLLRQGAVQLGYEVYGGETDQANASGILTFVRAREDLGRVATRLAEGGIRATLRKDRAGAPLLRFSPHFYNTEAEIDQVLAILTDTRGS